MNAPREYPEPKPRVCRCGHTKTEHCRAWGPNSIGEYGHGLCIAGWDELHGYVFKTPTACRCTKFRRRWLRWLAEVFLSDGSSVAELLVAAGHAVPYEGGAR